MKKLLIATLLLSSMRLFGMNAAVQPPQEKIDFAQRLENAMIQLRKLTIADAPVPLYETEEEFAETEQAYRDEKERQISELKSAATGLEIMKVQIISDIPVDEQTKLNKKLGKALHQLQLGFASFARIEPGRAHAWLRKKVNALTQRTNKLVADLEERATQEDLSEDDTEIGDEEFDQLEDEIYSQRFLVQAGYDILKPLAEAIIENTPQFAEANQVINERLNSIDEILMKAAALEYR